MNKKVFENNYTMELRTSDYNLKISCYDNMVWVTIENDKIYQKYCIWNCYRDVYRIGRVVQRINGSTKPVNDLAMEYCAGDDTYRMMNPRQDIFKEIVAVMPVLRKLNFVITKDVTDDKIYHWNSYKEEDNEKKD